MKKSALFAIPTSLFALVIAVAAVAGVSHVSAAQQSNQSVFEINSSAQDCRGCL